MKVSREMKENQWIRGGGLREKCPDTGTMVHMLVSKERPADKRECPVFQELTAGLHG